MLYEFGKTYNRFGDDFVEQQHLALWVTGKKQDQTWNATSDNVDFFYIKGLVEKILQKLGLMHEATIKPLQTDLFSEGLVYKIRKKKTIEIGYVRTSILKNFGIKQDVFYADFNWDVIFDLLKSKKTVYKEVSKYPFVRRDLALLLDKNICFSEIETLAFKSSNNLLKKVSLFDVYQGDKLQKNKKSYALSFIFRDEEKTLTDKVVDKAILKIYTSLEQELKVALRDGVL